MSDDHVNETEGRDDRLASAIAGVYGGPLADFVGRRDALAKALRAAGDRDAATAVKGLRKPSRVAWALNLAAPDTGPLEAAVAATLDAQAGGGDVRTAIAALRAAVRELASHAAQAAERGGHAVEAGVLASALLAVLGRPDSFAQLRAGCLADVPDAGGLDVFAALPEPTSSPVVRSRPGPPAETRARALAAQRALQEAESMLRAAELQLRQAEVERQSAHDRCEQAREDAAAAANRVALAERALADAEQQVLKSTR